jgi:hypothetical protein
LGDFFTTHLVTLPRTEENVSRDDSGKDILRQFQNGNAFFASALAGDLRAGMARAAAAANSSSAQGQASSVTRDRSYDLKKFG